MSPTSFQGRGVGSHGRVRGTFTAAAHSSWCCSSRMSRAGSVSLTGSLQGSEITVLCQETLLSPHSSHENPLHRQTTPRYSDLAFPVPQGPLIQKSTLCSNTSHHAHSHRALPSAPAKQPTKPYYWPGGSFGSWRIVAAFVSVLVSENASPLNGFVHSRGNPQKPRRKDLTGTELLSAALRRQLPRTATRKRGAVGA